MHDPTYGGRPLRTNLAATLLVQGANFIFPLALLPLLTRSLGVKAFGVYVLAFGIISYAAIAVEWGFNIGGARSVAQKRLDESFIRHLFWDVLLARFLLATIVSIVLLIFAFLTMESGLRVLLALGLIHVLATALNPDWFLVGLERSVNLSIATMAGRAMQLALTVLTVHAANDVPYAIASWGLASLFISLVALWSIRRIILEEPHDFSIVRSMYIVWNNATFFLVRSAVLLYAGSGTLILGATVGPVAAGVYGGADRISRAGLSFIGQIGGVIAPRINALMTHAPDQAVSFLRRAACVQLGLALALSATLYVLAKPIIDLMLGREFGGSILILKLLAPLPFLVVLGNLLGVQLLVPLGHERKLAFISVLTLPIFAALAYLGSMLYGVAGVPTAALVAELVSIVYQVNVIRTRSPKVWEALLRRAPAR